ncbi:D-ribose pyranase [Raineyella fluvialis]|uniref:D-ribose pyranase n=1 Tax=Raineyella fluvialis TaxID=2662261 RepID=A0A5Q2FAC1_9ACTN|nr:D-ribose pyranase [Raineyella fluvialis]QGF23920.1 D-ribose pyranase [Raineyella fluvialis]
MKKQGILNPALAAGLARLGHTQQVVIADCGLPLPAGAVVVDLTLVRGVPKFTEVLRAVLDEIVIEGALIAGEARDSVVETWVRELATGVADLEYLPHEDLKRRLPEASLIIRTGEDTPYANVVLTCSVPF